MTNKIRKEQNLQELDSPKEDDELELFDSPQNLYVKVYQMAERFAETRIGQFVIERGDRVLRMIEDTAKWSLPQDKSECKLERPMPWIPFLALIIVLRCTRIWLTVAAIMIGNGPVTPYEMVYFIQTRRRKLRSLRVHGMKVIRRRESLANSLRSGAGGRTEEGLMSKMRALLSRAICRPGQHREPERRVFINRGGMPIACSDEPTSSDRQTTKRPRDDEEADKNLTFDQMLTKYANQNSDDDSDFMPNPDDETNFDDESSSSNSSVANSSSSEALETEKSSAETEKKLRASQKNDNCIYIKANGGGHHSMPKPLAEIKMEPIADIDRNTELAHKSLQKNGPKNVIDKRETDVAQKNLKNNNLPKMANKFNTESRTTATTTTTGQQQHANAAIMEATAILPTLNSTAHAGSPSDFNASFFMPVSILKNPHIPQIQINAQPIEKDENVVEIVNKDINDSTTAAPKKHVQHQPLPRQHHQHQFRYRGRNRH